MPFLGRVTCNTGILTAGEWTEIVLDYEVGASGMADGAWFKATFKFYSDWALFQTADPAAANYVSAEYQAGPRAPFSPCDSSGERRSEPPVGQVRHRLEHRPQHPPRPRPRQASRLGAARATLLRR